MLLTEQHINKAIVCMQLRQLVQAALPRLLRHGAWAHLATRSKEARAWKGNMQKSSRLSLGDASPHGGVVHVAQHPLVHRHVPQPPVVADGDSVPPVLVELTIAKPCELR